MDAGPPFNNTHLNEIAGQNRFVDSDIRQCEKLLALDPTRNKHYATFLLHFYASSGTFRIDWIEKKFSQIEAMLVAVEVLRRDFYIDVQRVLPRVDLFTRARREALTLDEIGVQIKACAAQIFEDKPDRRDALPWQVSRYLQTFEPHDMWITHPDWDRVLKAYEDSVGRRSVVNRLSAAKELVERIYSIPSELLPRVSAMNARLARSEESRIQQASNELSQALAARTNLRRTGQPARQQLAS